jgi:hypothetical protein
MGIEIITHGWDRPDWIGTFYPDDLPAEWRLSYFANAFGAVLVPLDLWRRADPEVLAGWAADVPDGFGFYLETAAAPTQQERSRAAESLSTRLRGWVSLAGSRTADLPAWGHPDGAPLARLAPADLIATPRAALTWLSTLQSDAGARGALAILSDSPAEGLRRWQELVLLAGLA